MTTARRDPDAPSQPASRRKPDEIRELLLGAAESIVVRKGTSATALEIAREAGVHRSVLYRHFANADDLIRDAALRPFSDFLEGFESLAQAEPEHPQSLWALLLGFLDRLLASLEPHRQFLLAVAGDRDLLGGDNYGRLRTRLDAVLEQLSILSAAEGAVRGVDTGAMTTRIRFVVAMATGLVTFGDLLLPHGPEALGRDELIARLAEFILYGVKAPGADEVARDRRPPPRGDGA